MEQNVTKALFMAKKSKKVLKGIVRLAQKGSKESGGASLVVDYDGVRIVIPQEEVDMEVKYKSLVSFIGTQVIFVIIDVNPNEDCCIGSRARAQAILRPAITEKLNEGVAVEASVINILDHGAYLEVDGLTGLMKNIDFSADSTNVKDKLKIGDKITVQLKSKTSNGTILFEAVKKYVSPSAINKEDLKVGQTVCGTVRTKQPWGLFVNVAPGVDALVRPEAFDVDENKKVVISIRSIRKDEDKLKVRGNIIKVLD